MHIATVSLQTPRLLSGCFCQWVLVDGLLQWGFCKQRFFGSHLQGGFSSRSEKNA